MDQLLDLIPITVIKIGKLRDYELFRIFRFHT